jgi:prolipoprotein diacylglyceryltransferase
MVPALLGARLLYVALNWRTYRNDPTRIWRLSDGGAALYGGLTASFAFSLPLLAILRLPVLPFWDAATITMLIGMVFTKIGCHWNGCCAGRPVNGRMGLVLANAQGIRRRRVPVQLIEALLALMLLLGSIVFWNREPPPGAVFLAALGAYGAGRWALEATRETITLIGPISLNRAISAALVAISAAGFVLG